MIMFENSTYYQRYNNYGYRNYNNYYNPAFTNKYYSNPTIPNMDYTMSAEYNNNNNNSPDNNENNTNEEDVTKFRLGPLSVYNNSINIFGFSIAIDDLIIIAIIVLLFLQSDKNYTLLIVLGLMLFNISFSNLNLF